MKKIVILFCVCVSMISCSNKRIIHIYTPDKTKCVTIINDNNIRYIADGKISNVPDTNYIKLDVQNIDPLGDVIHICWNKDYVWDIVVHRSKVLESKLDTTRFSFKTSLPLNEIGVPTEKKFRKEGCAIFSFDLMRLSPNKGAVVEY